MNAYTASILKMKKLSQLGEEIVAVKHLISVENDRLLQEMVESHQTIFKSLNMSKIYFRQLLLQQQHANRLVQQFSSLLELPAPERLDKPPLVDQSNLLLQMHSSAGKLLPETRMMLTLLKDTYDGTQRCDCEAQVLKAYFLRGGANAHAVHMATQLQCPEQELDAAQPVPLDILQTLAAVVEIADPLPEQLQRAADAFVRGTFASHSFEPAEEPGKESDAINSTNLVLTLEKALQQAFDMGHAAKALQAPPEWLGFPQKAQELLKRAWALQRSFERLQEIKIPDLELFLKFIVQYDRKAFLAALSTADVLAVNTARVIAQIQQQICCDDNLRALFLQINDSDVLRQCLGLQEIGVDAAFWRSFGDNAGADE